jgi:hypothetical protein
LRQFRPLSDACSCEQWRRLVTSAAAHLMAAGDSELRYGDRIAEYRTGDDWTTEEEAARADAFLRQHLPVRDDGGVLFFWSASCAAETTWGVLVRYWSDFCYPSDDSNVIVPAEGDRLAVYVEGLVWVAPRVPHSIARDDEQDAAADTAARCPDQRPQPVPRDRDGVEPGGNERIANTDDPESREGRLTIGGRS